MQTNQVNIFEDNDHFFKGKYDSSDSLKDPNPRDTTTRGISLKRVAVMIAILVAIFALGTLYDEVLFEMSREVILRLG